MNGLAFNLAAVGEDDRPEELLREALGIIREVRGLHPDTAIALNDLGYFLYARDRLDGVEDLYRESLEMKRQLFGDVHPELAITLMKAVPSTIVPMIDPT